MAIWTNCTLTKVGRQLIAHCQANNIAMHISNCSLSSHNYSGVDLSNLTFLDDIEQTVSIGDMVVNGDEYTVSANFDNNTLATGYQLYSYGVFANDGGANVLLLVGTTTTPDTVPSVSEAPWQAIINSHITISNAPTITVNVDMAANATMQYVQNYVNTNVIDLIATTETANSIVARDENGYIFANTPDGKNDKALVNKEFLNSTVIVSLPTTGWTAENGYQKIQINNDKFYAEYTGCRNFDFVRPTKNASYLTNYDAYKETAALITDIESYNGYIIVYASEVPTTAIQLIFYGV